MSDLLMLLGEVFAIHCDIDNEGIFQRCCTVKLKERVAITALQAAGDIRSRKNVRFEPSQTL
jgi:hypothetical protein